MMRWIRTLIVLSLAVILIGQGGAHVPAQSMGRVDSPDAAQWRTLAEDAVERFELLAGPNELAHTHAYAAQAYAWLSPDGWNDADAVAHLNAVRALKNPDGGWGLGFAYDFAGDGTVNPANTSYVITATDHVGPVMIDAYKAGAATRAEVQSIVTWVMGTPRIQSANTPYGQCVAYSRSANDQAPAHCVHNVNASVANFLTEAISAGVGAGGAQKLIVDITRREIYAYLPISPQGRPAWWRYMDTITENDVDHNGAEAWFLYGNAYPVAREAAYQIMAGTTVDASAPLAYARLTGLPGGVGSMSTDGSAKTLWCQMGRDRVATVATYLSSAAVRQVSQVAYFAARNARNC